MQGERNVTLEISLDFPGNETLLAHPLDFSFRRETETGHFPPWLALDHLHSIVNEGRAFLRTAYMAGQVGVSIAWAWSSPRSLIPSSMKAELCCSTHGRASQSLGLCMELSKVPILRPKQSSPSCSLCFPFPFSSSVGLSL